MNKFNLPEVLESELSLQRPAWRQRDLNAYNHRIHGKHGDELIKDINYFVKTGGLVK